MDVVARRSRPDVDAVVRGWCRVARLLTRCAASTGVLRVELNAAAANPLVDAATGQVLHNGNFHGAYLGLALDSARLALCVDAALSPTRLARSASPSEPGCAHSSPTAQRQSRDHDPRIHGQRRLGGRPTARHRPERVSRDGQGEAAGPF